MSETSLNLTSPPSASPSEGEAEGEGGSPAFDAGSLAEIPVRELLTREELRADPGLQDFNDLDTFASAYLATKRMVGADGTKFARVTDADSEDEGVRNEYYSKLGRPEEPTGYVFPEVEGGIEALGMADGDIADFQQAMHAAGLSGKHFQAVTGWYAKWGNSSVQRQSESAEAQAAESMAALRTDWGEAFDQNVLLAKATVQQLGIGDWLAAKGLEDDPEMARLVVKLGESMREDDVRIGGQGGAAFGNVLSPDQAKAEITSLRMDGEFMQNYQDASRPGHQAAVARMTRLNQMAFPE